MLEMMRVTTGIPWDLTGACDAGWQRALPLPPERQDSGLMLQPADRSIIHT